MPDEFQYDVFLSHSAKDKSVVRDVAERLRKDGFNDSQPSIVPTAPRTSRQASNLKSQPAARPDRSRVLACPAEASARRRMLCMSANAFASDWAQLESGAFRFRDPLNKERRFIPTRLDEVPIRGFLRLPFTQLSLVHGAEASG